LLRIKPQSYVRFINNKVIYIYTELHILLSTVIHLKIAHTLMS